MVLTGLANVKIKYVAIRRLGEGRKSVRPWVSFVGEHDDLRQIHGGGASGWRGHQKTSLYTECYMAASSPEGKLQPLARQLWI